MLWKRGIFKTVFEKLQVGERRILDQQVFSLDHTALYLCIILSKIFVATDEEESSLKPHMYQFSCGL